MQGDSQRGDSRRFPDSKSISDVGIKPKDEYWFNSILPTIKKLRAFLGKFLTRTSTWLIGILALCLLVKWIEYRWAVDELHVAARLLRESHSRLARLEGEMSSARNEDANSAVGFLWRDRVRSMCATVVRLLRPDALSTNGSESDAVVLTLAPLTTSRETTVPSQGKLKDELMTLGLTDTHADELERMVRDTGRFDLTKLTEGIAAVRTNLDKSLPELAAVMQRAAAADAVSPNDTTVSPLVRHILLSLAAEFGARREPIPPVLRDADLESAGLKGEKEAMKVEMGDMYEKIQWRGWGSGPGSGEPHVGFMTSGDKIVFFAARSSSAKITRLGTVDKALIPDTAWSALQSLLESAEMRTHGTNILRYWYTQPAIMAARDSTAGDTVEIVFDRRPNPLPGIDDRFGGHLTAINKHHVGKPMEPLYKSSASEP